MQTAEQGSLPQPDPAAGAPPVADAKVSSVAEPPKNPETTTVSKTDLEELQRLAKDAEHYRGAVARLEQENSEYKVQVEELSQKTTSTPIFGQLPDNMTEEEAKGIERDFKRQSRDLLNRRKDLADLTPKQRREFDKEYQLRSSVIYQESLKLGEFVPVSELEDSFETALRFVKGITNEEEIRKAKLATQKEMLDRESGNIPNASQSSSEKKVEEISAEALAEADRSLLVKEGLMAKEEMAKRIQKRINEGR